jgi:hypothetical protein
LLISAVWAKIKVIDRQYRRKQDAVWANEMFAPVLQNDEEKSVSSSQYQSQLF